jgi:error-prone DNA polymerase
MAEYVELHCHSCYSFLDGASPPEVLAARAAALGYPALALTEHDGLYGAVRFWEAARTQGIRPVIGAEVTLEEICPERPGVEKDRRSSHLTLLAET